MPLFFGVDLQKVYVLFFGTGAKMFLRKTIECRDWEWADLDKKSLVWAMKGCIYRASIQSGAKIRDPKLLYDFNSLEFKRIRAPY